MKSSINKNIIEKIRAGDKTAIGRAISLVENDTPEGLNLLHNIYKFTGKAYRIGFTGPQGVGKSSLIAHIIEILRKDSKTVGIISVDPTSAITGGAFLGDRIRMQRFSLDDGVFIRSMATRGHSGGLSQSTIASADILDASGKDFIIIETVGVGQTEIEIARNVDTLVLVFSPESGDAIQTLKAGLIEFAEVIVVNKCDRDESDKFFDSLNFALDLMYSKKLQTLEHDAHHRLTSSKEISTELLESKKGWRPQLLKTSCLKNIGCKELLNSILKHREFITSTGEFENRRKEHIKSRIFSIINTAWQKKISELVKKNMFGKEIEMCLTKEKTPYEIAHETINKLLKRKTQDF